MAEHNQQLYRTLFEAAADPIVLLTENGRFVEANYNALAIFGCVRDGLIDHDLVEFLPETQPDGHPSAAVLAEMLAAGLESWHQAELICHTAAGDPFTARLTLYSIAVGETRYLQASVRDVSDIKEGEARYRTIVENIQDGFYEVDLKGNHTLVNQAICDIVGYSEAELLGMNYRDYMDEATIERVFNAFNGVYQTGIAHPGVEYNITTKDGQLRTIQTSISLITDAAGQPAGFRGIVRDVTVRKAQEVAREESRLRLESDVETQTESVLEANAQLLEQMAEQVAVEEELERRNRTLEALSILSREASFKEDLGPILDTVTQFTGELLNVTSVYLSTWDQDAGTTQVISEYLGPDANDKERVSDKGVVYDLEKTFGTAADWINSLESHYLLYVDDPDLDPGERKHFEQYGNITEMGIPLIARGIPIGMLEVWDSRRRREFSEEEIELLMAIGRQVSVTFDNARLYQEAVATQAELETRAESLQITNAVADTLYRAREMGTVVEEALDAIVDYTNAPSAAFYRLDNEANALQMVSSRGVPDDLVSIGSTLPLSGSLSGITVQRQEIITVADILADDRLESAVKEALIAQDLKNVVSVPLLFQNQVLGVINLVYQEPPQLEVQERETLLAVGKTVALAMSNAQYVEQIEREIAERQLAERKQQQSLQSQAVLNALLELSLEEASLDELLDRAFELIIDTPWFTALPQGSIFLVEEDQPDVLVLKSKKHLSKPLQKKCALVEFGQCLCGRAASSGEIVFADCLDDRHETRYRGIKEHGHYNVPIKLDEQVVGVINLYVEHGHQRSEEEVAFLEAAAGTLASLIKRKRSEEATALSQARFRYLFEGSPDAVVLIDPYSEDVEWEIIDANPAAAAMNGYELDEIIGQSIHIWHDEATAKDQAGLKAYLEQLRRDKQLTGESVHVHKDGHTFPIESAARLIELGGKELILGIDRDITERKAAEAAIRAQEEQAVRFQDKLQALQEVSLELSRIDNLDDLYRRAVELGLEKLGFDRLGLLLYDAENHDLVGTYGVSSQGELTDEHDLREPVTEDLADILNRHTRIRLLEDVDLWDPGEVVGHGWNALTGLWDGDQGIGWLSIDNVLSGIEPSPQLMDLLVLYANNIGSLITRKRTEREIEESLTERSRQVQISTQVAQEVAQAADLDELYRSVVRLVKEEFDFYHVQLLRYDPMLDAVTLEVGYGETGEKMREQGHAMSMGVGIIGTAAATGESILRSTLADDPDWRPNPLLPETRGELAVPIKFGAEMLGVLDVQSSVAGALNADDQLVLEGLCGQVAIAIESTRLRQEMGRRIDELNTVQQQMSREGWESYRATRRQLPGYQFDMSEIVPIDTAIRPGNGKKQAQVATPLAIRGEQLATLFIEDDPERPLSPEDQAFLGAVSSQIAEALEAARLFEQTQDSLAEQERLASELETVAEVSTVAATILEADKLLQSVVDLAKSSFHLYHAHIYLMNSTGRLELKAGADTVGRLMTLEGREIRLDADSLVARSARERAGVMVGDVRQSPDFLPHPLLPDTRSELAVPMIVGDDVIGVLDLQSNKVDHFTDEAMQIYRTLASQVAVAVQNAHLYAEQVAATEKLREVDRLKSEFLASMSHELRTPLNSIIGFADVLLEGLDGPLNERMEQDVRLIRDSGRHLRELMGDILDMSKIEAGRMDLRYENIDMQQMAKDILATAAPLAQEKNLYLKGDIGEEVSTVEADRTRIRQILWNITGNAIKFTQKGGVTLSMKIKEDNLLVGIHDTGIGIKEEDIAVVFEQFRQIDGSLNRSVGGTGLGMPITRNLVELHGGQIWIESTMGVGTTFWFTIPIEKSPPRTGTGPL